MVHYEHDHMVQQTMYAKIYSHVTTSQKIYPVRQGHMGAHENYDFCPIVCYHISFSSFYADYPNMYHCRSYYVLYGNI